MYMLPLVAPVPAPLHGTPDRKRKFVAGSGAIKESKGNNESKANTIEMDNNPDNNPERQRDLDERRQLRRRITVTRPRAPLDEPHSEGNFSTAPAQQLSLLQPASVTMPSSAEICAFFFDEGAEYRYTCKICNGARKQAPATGYSNLLSHLGTKHPDYLTEMATSRRAEDGTMESFGFVSETVDHLYRWLRWGVVRNHPLCDVDDPLTRAMSRLRPTSSKSLNVKMHIAATKIGALLEEEMGDAFVVEGSQTADVHIDHFKRVLDLYNKTLDMVLFVVGDNCTTNRSIATKLGMPLVGCASHRLNLAVQVFLKQFEAELDQVKTLMVQLRQPNNSAELAKFTDLRPIKRNVTRWSSTREMVSRYITIRADIRKVEAAEDFVPSPSAHRKLMLLNEDLCVIDSVCKKLQDEETSMADTRLLFSSLLFSNGYLSLARNAREIALQTSPRRFCWKRKPQGNLTLSQVESVPSQILQQPADQGIVAGLMTDEARLEHGAVHDADDHGTGVAERLLEVNDWETAEDNFSGWWYFDTASNSHVIRDRSFSVSFTEDTTQLRSIRGITPTIAARIAGMGTVAVTTEVNGEQTMMYLEDVFYIPGAEYGLFSPGLAHEQGFDFTFDHDTQDFTILWEGRAMAIAKPQEATWGFQVTYPGQTRVEGPVDRRPLANFTMAEGVGTLALWHERMCHICPQYLKTMVDKGLVRGMMLTQRHQQTCDACHLGKQKKKAHRKKLDRATKRPNQVVYADLLIPSKDNRTRYEAVLVVMDGYSRFVKVFLLTSKESPVVNKHLQEYILWTERQAGRDADGVTYKVKQVLTDKGSEFINRGMENWYARRGIEHIRVGPKSSQLNLCERTHQSLVDMMKTTMVHAGFPRSLWPVALRNAVYVKNRVCNRGTQGVPYEMMFGMKPDVHHIRKFGSLAYVHVPVTSGRRKHDDNAKIGFVLGYEEDVVGCKVYFPDEHTAKFVSDLRVAEERDEEEGQYESSSSEHEMETSMTQSDLSEPNSVPSNELEGSVVDVEANRELEKGEEQDTIIPNALETRQKEVESTEQLDQEDLGGKSTEQIEVGSDSHVGDELRSEVAHDLDCGDVESVAGTCGSSVDDEDVEDEDEGGPLVDEDVTMASVFSLGEETISVETTQVPSVVGLEEDPETINVLDEQSSGVVDKDNSQTVDASALYQREAARETGKRTHRDETQSEEARVEQEAAKPDTKRTRTGLREANGHSYVVLKALYGLRQSGREWNSELNDWFIQREYQRSLTEPCLYYLFEDDTIVYVLVNVDDILAATNSKQYKDKLFRDLDDTYGLKDQGLLTQYLGVEVIQTPEYIMIGQSKYAREILSKLGFENAHTVGNPMEVNARLTPLGEKESADSSFPYREAIGMLMYLATSTRPDLAYALGQLSRFVANPSQKHIGTVTRVLRYLAGALDYGIKYERKKNNSTELVLQGYCDSDWANDPDQRKSTTGFVFTLAGEAVAWMSRRQSVIALSTAEAEYIAACEATMEAVAAKNVLQEILSQHEVKLRVGIDNQAAHVMATNPTYSRRTRHFELRWHYVREQVQKGTVELHKVKGETNPADTFTKPLDKKRLKALLLIVGIGAEK